MPAAAAPTAPTAPAKTEPTQATIDTPEASDKAPAEFMADIIGDFAEMDAGRTPAPRDDKGKFKSPESTKKPAAKKSPEKAPEAKVEKPKEQTTEPEKPAEGEKPKTEEAPQPKSYMRTLGERYDNLKKQVEKEYKPEIQRLQSRVKELETAKPEDNGASAQLKALQERNEHLEKVIAFRDFTEDKTYQENYVRPYSEAWKVAVDQFSKLRVREPDGTDESTGEPKFKTRQATTADILRLGSMNEADLDETAQREFGASSARVIAHIEKLRELSSAKDRAESEARERAVEWKKQQQASVESQTGKMAKIWSEVDKDLREKLPAAFSVDSEDEGDKTAHTKGFALANLAFMGEKSLSPEQIETLPTAFRDTLKEGKPLTEEQRVQVHALTRLKAANHDRLMAKLKVAQGEIAELRKSLEQYEKSEPDAAKAGARQSSDGKSEYQSMDQIEEELRALDK